MSHLIPETPWQSISSDCFEIDCDHYVVIVDSYSGYIDFAKLKDLSGKSLVNALKPILATHGSPAVFISDNGTNYKSQEFEQFAREWDFTHTVSSPHHKKSNGRAEAAVKVMKRLIKKSKKAKVDIYKSLLEWRNTVTPGCQSSPMQKLASRRARSFLPCKQEKYMPKLVEQVPEKIIERKMRAKSYYDQRTKTLPQLVVGQPIRVKTHPQLRHSTWKQGKVLSEAAPRSYKVDVNGTTYTRNRVHLRDSLVPLKNEESKELIEDDPVVTIQAPIPTGSPSTKTQAKTPVRSPVIHPMHQGQVVTRSGRVVKPNPKYSVK